MNQLGYLIPAAIVLAAIATLLGWDLIQAVRNTPSRRDRR